MIELAQSTIDKLRSIAKSLLDQFDRDELSVKQYVADVGDINRAIEALETVQREAKKEKEKEHKVVYEVSFDGRHHELVYGSLTQVEGYAKSHVDSYGVMSVIIDPRSKVPDTVPFNSVRIL